MIASKALVIGAYQRKLDEIAAIPEVELIAVVPPSWRDPSYEQVLEHSGAAGYEMVVTPMAFNGDFHLFFYPQLGRLLDRYEPDLLHFDEEPYNTSTFLAVAQARRRRIPALFFTWQNLNRRYPPPFSWMERYIYRAASWAIAGTAAAERVLRQKGYRGPASVIPQFGVDPDRFAPTERGQSDRPFTVGFVGRLVPEKGVDLLVDACARMESNVRLVIVGDGPARTSVEERIRARGMMERTHMVGAVASAAIPAYLAELDVIVLPSLSQPNWKEQFGRILVEAMASGVSVVGSTCGEIPEVIDDAGLTFPEGDCDALASVLDRLARDAALRAELTARGRQRALERFTHRSVAHDTVAVYRQVLQQPVVVQEPPSIGHE
jgi:glycosyltransferase involved in cell wall biosynthesis